MQQQWSLLLGAGMLMMITHASLAADAPAAPPAAAPAPKDAQASHAAPPSSQGNAKGRAAKPGEAQRECASRMYGALPRGRGAPNWPLYDRCMRQRGAA